MTDLIRKLTLRDFTVGDRVAWIDRDVLHNGTVVEVPPAGMNVVNVQPDGTDQTGGLACSRLTKMN